MTAGPIRLEEPTQGALRAARALLRRKERLAARKFLVEGRQGVREALKTPGAVESVFLWWRSAHDNLDLIDLARAVGVTVYGVSEQNLAAMSDTVTPQGIVAVANAIDVPLSSLTVDPVTGDKADISLVVVCAQIRDPGNAGTVVRVADAFGADAVIFSSDSVEVYNPKVVRSSVGSIFHLPIVVGANLQETIDACRAAGLQVFATDGESETLLPEIGDRLAEPTAWVMGNEAWGLPVEHLELADETVAVPIYGQAESLNLATAAAVCLYASASAQRAVDSPNP